MNSKQILISLKVSCRHILMDTNGECKQVLYNLHMLYWSLNFIQYNTTFKKSVLIDFFYDSNTAFCRFRVYRLTRATRRVPYMKQRLLFLSEHFSHSRVFLVGPFCSLVFVKFVCVVYFWSSLLLRVCQYFFIISIQGTVH